MTEFNAGDRVSLLENPYQGPEFDEGQTGVILAVYNDSFSVLLDSEHPGDANDGSWTFYARELQHV